MPDDTTQLTVKSFPVASRDKMGRLAKRRGHTLSRWLSEAVDHAESVQSGDLVEPARFQPRPQMLPEPVAAPDSHLTLAEITDAMRAAADLAAVTDIALPPATVRLAYWLLADTLRSAKRARQGKL